jgi:hypothetical protein
VEAETKTTLNDLKLDVATPELPYPTNTSTDVYILNN